MKDRLLFWVDIGLKQFGTAKFLQEKYDCDMFAIYDFNHHLKKSFINQKIVNFQKEWYFWDHVSKTNKKADLEYLRSFEGKYKINLWLIAYSERIFFKYNPLYKFKADELLSILEQECRFFESVLDEIKPDFLIVKFTDFHREHLLIEMCKSRGVKVLMLIPSLFGYRAILSTDPSKIDYSNDIKNERKYNHGDMHQLQNYRKKFDKFKQEISSKSGGIGVSILKKVKPTLRWMTKTFDKEYRNSYDHYGMTRLKVIAKITYCNLKGRYRKLFIDRNFVRKIDENDKFIYFPLQVEPERTTTIATPFYSNQLEVIINIAKSLPVGYNLYVKEHYNMKFRNWRTLSYYKSILDLPNAKLIHPSVKPEEMLSKCSLIITITGTAGVEAAFHGKPSIVIGDVIYSSLPSVYKLKNIEELPQAIRTSLQKKVNLSDLNEFVNLIDENSVEFDVVGFHNDVLHRFYNDGFLMTDDISMHELSSFLEENRSMLEQLALEHIKKINQHKKYSIM